MSTPEALRALADRVEAGESGREIDAEVMALFYRRGERHIGIYDDTTDEPVMSGVWIDPATDKWVMTTAAWWQPSNGNADLGFWDLVESGTYADDSEVVPEYWMPLPAPPTPSVQETDDGRE